MAGERSKSIGEVGENIAENFFSRIGWEGVQKGIYFPCLKKEKHALKTSKRGEKNQHGIDFQYSYKSSLESQTVNNLVISVKHHKDDGYPRSATTKFKGYIKDLSDTLECFKKSAKRKDLLSDYRGIRSVNDIPVLFYLSSKDDENIDFVSYLFSSRFINDYDLKGLYVIDNKRVTFALKTLEYVSNRADGYDWFYFYPVSGMNFEDADEHKLGKKMQIEFICSGFVPFVLKKKSSEGDVVKFLIVSEDEFSEENLFKFVGYARNNTSDVLSEIEVAMSNYYPDDHDSIIRKVRSRLNSEINVVATNYESSFRGLNNG